MNTASPAWSGLVLVALAILVCPLSAAVITIDAQSNLFYSGMGIPGNIIPDEGLFPAGIDLTAYPGATSIRFLSVAGAWSYMPDYPPAQNVGPDGLYQPSDGFHTGTNLESHNNYSAIRHDNRVMFLAGVFVGSSLPLAAPAALDFSDAGTITDQFTSLNPVIGQIFLVGDGRTSGNILQEFQIPGKALFLYLGVVDGYNFQGHPTTYTDNSGAMTATYELNSPIPEPAAFTMLALGLAGLGVLRRYVLR